MSEIGFESTGDPQKDAELAAQIRKHERNTSEGMCPNGCAPVVWEDPHHHDCPKCGFHGWTSRPYNGLK